MFTLENVCNKHKRIWNNIIKYMQIDLECFKVCAVNITRIIIIISMQIKSNNINVY